MARRRKSYSKSHHKYHRKNKLEKYMPLIMLGIAGVVVAVAYKGGQKKVLLSSEIPPDVLPAPTIAYKLPATKSNPTNPAIGMKVTA